MQKKGKGKKLILRWRQLKNGVGVSSEWEDFSVFEEWFNKNSKGIVSPTVRRRSRLGVYSEDNCIVANQKDRTLINKEKVAPRIYKRAYADGSVTFTALSNSTSSRGLTLGVFGKLSDAIHARDGNGDTKAAVRRVVDGRVITVIYEGVQFKRPFCGYVDGYPVGWYATAKEAEKEAIAQAPYAEMQNEKLKAVGENDISKFDIQELLASL